MTFHFSGYKYAVMFSPTHRDSGRRAGGAFLCVCVGGGAQKAAADKGSGVGGAREMSREEGTSKPGDLPPSPWELS